MQLDALALTIIRAGHYLFSALVDFFPFSHNVILSKMNFRTLFCSFFLVILCLVPWLTLNASGKQKKWKKKRRRRKRKKTMDEEDEERRKNDDERETAFREYLRKLKDSDDYRVTSGQLREIIKDKYLLYSELQSNPEKFFRLHEILAEEGVDQVALGIKFTVQFNLYSGSVFFLGSPEQIKLLEDSQDEGSIGCFALTEKNSGVVSGMLIETNMEYNHEEKSFMMNTPNIAVDDSGIVDFDNTGACKTWISQAHASDYMVVFGNLIMPGDEENPEGGENKGIHSFFLKMSDYNVVRYDSSVERSPMEPNTIYMELMEGKGSFVGLDNSKIIFNEVKIPASSLLSRYCEIDLEKGEYEVKGGLDKFTFMVIAQRLLTGRIVIGNTMLIYFRNILKSVINNILNVRNIPVGAVDKTIPLGQVPHIRDYVRKLRWRLDEYKVYCEDVIEELCGYLKSGEQIPDSLFERICISKIYPSNFCIKHIFQLKQVVGSESLFTRNLLSINTDVFYCALFAEGDNNILQQKITRDHLYALRKARIGKGKMLGLACKNEVLKRVWGMLFSPSDRKRTIERLEMQLQNKLFVLGYNLTKAGRDRDKKIKLWMEEYEKIQGVADIVSEIQILKALERKNF